MSDLYRITLYTNCSLFLNNNKQQCVRRAENGKCTNTMSNLSVFCCLKSCMNNFHFASNTPEISSKNPIQLDTAFMGKYLEPLLTIGVSILLFYTYN